MTLQFDRHALFSDEMTRQVMNLARRVDDHNFEVGKLGFCSLYNNLYGMLDGFLYESTLQLAERYPAELRDEIVELYNKIHTRIEENGESETQIF